MRMRNIISTSIILYFMLHTLVVHGDEICTRYLESENPASTLQKLKTETTPKSQFCVGAMYFKGVGIKQNYAESFKWFKKAADQNFPPAQRNLGYLYVKGKGVALDEEKAFKWVLKAAQQNDAPGQFNLGIMYYKGTGMNRNLIEAVKWFKKADLQDYKPASEILRKLTPKLSWKKSSGTLKTALLLFDKSGNAYPNNNHRVNNISKKNYLNIKKNGKVTGAVYFLGCDLDSSGHCTETASIAVFRPDWSLIREVNDMGLLKLRTIKPSKNNQSSNAAMLRSDITMTIIIDSDEPAGRYHILVTVFNSKGELKVELNQVFWVRPTEA